MTKPVISEQDKRFLEDQGIDVTKIRSKKDFQKAYDEANTELFRRIAIGRKKES